MTQEFRDGLTMNKSLVNDMIFYFVLLVIVAAAAAVSVAISAINLLDTPSPKQKDYILHSITADGTAFYLHMDEEEYQQWASENYIKIKKLQLEEK